MLKVGTLTGPVSYGQAINAIGYVVGRSRTGGSGDPVHAYLFKDGQMVDLHPPSWPRTSSSQAEGVNDKGQVVGMVTNQDGSRTIASGFIWENGRFTALDQLYEATTINNKGQVVGTAADRGKPQAAALYDFNTGAYRELGYVNDQFRSVAMAITDSGVVAGSGGGSGGRTNRSWQAFIWKDGKLTPLPDLGVYRNSMAYGINEAEEVVGYASTVVPPDASLIKRAVLWRDGQVVDLNTLLPPGTGWVLEEARAINNKRQIVGSGSLNGQTRAFLLTPGTGPVPTGGAPTPTAPTSGPTFDSGATVEVVGAGDCVNARQEPFRLAKCSIPQVVVGLGGLWDRFTGPNVLG